MRIPSTALLPSAGIIAAALTLAACGGSSSPGANAAAAERAQEARTETRFQDFARCLREHGIEAEALSRPGGGHGLKVSPGRGAGPASMEAAQRACARYRPEEKKVDLSPQQKVEIEEHLQRFARCMREHGIHVEVGTKGGGVQFGIRAHAGSGLPNPESPAFQQAQTSCQHLMPKPPGGGPHGFPPRGGLVTR